jgi:hypothetical protein
MVYDNRRPIKARCTQIKNQSKPHYFFDGKHAAISCRDDIECGKPVLYTVTDKGKVFGILLYDNCGNYLLQTKIRGLSSVSIDGQFSSLDSNYLQALINLYSDYPETLDIRYCPKEISETDKKLITQARANDDSFARKAATIPITYLNNIFQVQKLISSITTML